MQRSSLALGLGGGMRQSGLLAAACLYALEHNVARLAEDHENAAHLAGVTVKSGVSDSA
ncbi:threonine aldolase [Caballeronia arationis]|jgi:threonine aldolase|nr:threonine aldolase [Caballeronia arationis]